MAATLPHPGTHLPDLPEPGYVLHAQHHHRAPFIMLTRVDRFGCFRVDRLVGLPQQQTHIPDCDVLDKLSGPCFTILAEMSVLFLLLALADRERVSGLFNVSGFHEVSDIQTHFHLFDTCSSHVYDAFCTVAAFSNFDTFPRLLSVYYANALSPVFFRVNND